MCGICGIFDLKNENRIDNSIVQKMCQKLIHRGPDAIGYFTKNNIALGFVRLSILDLEGGMQPIYNEDQSIVLICNGEIFNYIELKNALSKRGHVFKTNSDIEVIIHLYEEHSLNFINQLNGQFAFVIFDMKKKLLLCARDHFGIAPLFYTTVNGIFIFASEIKALLEYPLVTREVDLTGLDQILQFPGLVSPRTLFKNIKSLESGHFLLIKNSEQENIEYWDLIYPKSDEIDYSDNENYYSEKLDELITKAVKYRLQADVPVGFYISGGLDSSFIAAKIEQCSFGLKKAFSINFENEEISESKYQRLMLKNINALHCQKLFKIFDIAKRLRKAVYYSECALKETYNTASLALSESVKAENTKVILTGEGADELFGGYVGYKFDKIRQQQPKQYMPSLICENEIRKKIWGDENFFYEKNYYSYQTIRKKIYSENLCNVYNEFDCLNYEIININRIKQLDYFHKRSYVDFKLRLSDHLLADHGDRMCYANSVEARYPFLDKDLVEFVRLIPSSIKLKGYDEKYILKKISNNIVPKEIINRPKFAFVAPGSPELLKQNIEYINDLISFERIKKQGYFNPDTIENYKKQYIQDSFKLNLPYDDDMLIIAITFGIFLEEFGMPDLN